MEGIELACRFSFITNKLRYCGPKDAFKEYKKYIHAKKSNMKKIEDSFKKYEGLYVYLKNIAKNKYFLDYDVVEAYWIGNELLDNFPKEDLKKIIMELSERGLSKIYADHLIKKLPEGMNPHHSFNVLFVGVGKTTGSVATNIITMNKCLIRIGRVLKITKKDIIVQLENLNIKCGVLIWDNPVIEHIQCDFNVKINDYVAVHWDYSCKVLNEKEIKNLKKYTQQNIDSLNKVNYFRSFET